MSPNPQETADLVTFTAEKLNGKLQFLCSVICIISSHIIYAKVDQIKKILLDKRYDKPPSIYSRFVRPLHKK